MKYLVLCFVLVIKTEGILFAQETKDTVYIKPGQYMQEEMVISASRWEQNPDEMAARITPIKLQDIRMQNPQTAADVLAVSGGIHPEKSACRRQPYDQRFCNQSCTSRARRRAFK